MSTPEQPFSQRAAGWLVGVAGLSLVGSLALAIFVEGPREVPSAGSDTFSRSALGHSGIVQLLRDQGVPVTISRYESIDRVGDSGTLVLAEPRATDQLSELTDGVVTAVIVLPKRQGVPDFSRPEWIASAELVDPSVPAEVLEELGITGEIVRPESFRLDVNQPGITPSLAHPQLVRTDQLQSLLAGPDGVLVGVHSTDEHDWLIISDPDLLANHGLAVGDNAALVVTLLDDFRGEGSLVFDETLHGHVLEPSIWNELGRFPLSLATLSAALILAALLWSAGRRFGPPLAAPPAIAPGKQFLVDNTAALMAHGGHSAETLARYHQACLADIARALHVKAEDVPAIARARELPAELDPDGLAREVADLSQPHSGQDRAATRALAVAVRLHRFRQDESMDLQAIAALRASLRAELSRVVVGQEEVIDSLLLALLCEGHVLLEGVPGTAKTLLARAFATVLDMRNNRIQFTPDLMPGDVLGTNLFNFHSNTFVLTKGPIFTELLLADEINRTPPKTQAALLQAMQERQVSIDGQTHPLGPGFMVVATQNPIEQEGTYPLPEAQLDRFLFKIIVGYPGRDQERELVRVHGHRTAMPSLDEMGLRPVASLAHILEARKTVAGIRLSDPLIDYVVDLVRATRERPSLLCGASPRSAAMLAAAARAAAALAGREFVIPDDVKSLALPALRHRVVLAPGAELEGQSAESVIRQVLTEVAAPR